MNLLKGALDAKPEMPEVTGLVGHGGRLVRGSGRVKRRLTAAK